MNYNKIKEILVSKNILINDFIKEKVGMSVHGFNQSLKNGTLQVKKLEIISRELKVPITYWWDKNDPLLITDSEMKDGEIKDKKIEILEEEIVYYKMLLRKITEEEIEKTKKEKLASSDI